MLQEMHTYSCQLRLHPELDEGGKHDYITSSVLVSSSKDD